MVTFKLVFKNSKRAVYFYYPEGKEDKRHGIIVIDFKTRRVSVCIMAEEDFERVITKAEQNECRDSVNKIRIENGEKPLLEEDWLIATEDWHIVYYADHVITKLVKDYNKTGEITKDGKVAWY